MTLNRPLRVFCVALLAVGAQVVDVLGGILLTVTNPNGTALDFELVAFEAIGSTTFDTRTSRNDGLLSINNGRASELLALLVGQGRPCELLLLRVKLI